MVYQKCHSPGSWNTVQVFIILMLKLQKIQKGSATDIDNLPDHQMTDIAPVPRYLHNFTS